MEKDFLKVFDNIVYSAYLRPRLSFFSSSLAITKTIKHVSDLKILKIKKFQNHFFTVSYLKLPYLKTTLKS